MPVTERQFSARLLTALVAGFAAGAVVAGCGNSAIYTPTVTEPTISQSETGPGATGTASSSSSTSTTAQTVTVNSNAGAVPLRLQIGPNGVNYQPSPVLAPVNVPATPLDVDGVMCQPARQLAYRVHAHLSIYVHGDQLGVPGGIGMVAPTLQQTDNGPVFTANTCYYWLHTTTQDGLIFVESPLTQRFTLGQFFAIWGAALSRDALGDHRGAVTAIVDGRRWRGSLAAIPLLQHTEIELALGRPVPRYKAVDWSGTSL